ncbi:MAG: phenylalanine--tRNA ligase subunit beta [Acidobacteriota bacterium]|nr:MAG: phenylalanine--tRNA ligase subunit beta [Acidobacteriota bacterium]
MKISYSWLQDYVDIDMLGVGVEEVARALTMVGLAVEGIEEVGPDTVFDLDVTTNRPDCLSHLGVARELAAQFRLRLNKPEMTALPTVEAQERLPIEIAIEEPGLCPRYAGRVLTDVRIEESPDWLKARLEAVGQRPINNIVDVTNFVLFGLGHPLHAFDYQKLNGRKIVVRRARLGERITTLDEVKRELTPEMLMICDAQVPVAVAGVMGGADSEIGEGSTTILLESAFFQPATVRSTARSLGLSTEASYRFERRADPMMPVQALNYACRLICEMTGARCVSEVVDENPAPYAPRPFTLRLSRIKQVMGVDVSAGNVADILSGLGFAPEVQGEEAVEVCIPSFRGDVDVEDDLVEEVARHVGYDKIPTRYPAPTTIGHFTAEEPHDRRIISTLVGLGFYEAMNLSFTIPAKEERFLTQVSAMIPISNPLTEMDTHLRTMLAPGLVESLRQNLNFGNRNVRLFELGPVFFPGESENFTDHREVRHLALAATGEAFGSHWNHSAGEFDFFHLKGVVERLLAGMGATAEFEQLSDSAYLHPGVAASIRLGGETIGVIGELHPRVAEAYKFTTRVLIAEFSLESLYAAPLAEPEYQRLVRFPAVERDLSFLLDREMPFSTITSAVQALRVQGLKDFRLIDLYYGQNLPQGKISLTVRFTFEDPTGTLTQNEVSERYSQVVEALKLQFAIEPR